MSDEAPAFVDANILVYAFDSSDPPRHRSATDLLSRLMDDDRLAARSGADTLYTEDLNDGQILRGVRVVNPFKAAPRKPRRART